MHKIKLSFDAVGTSSVAGSRWHGNSRDEIITYILFTDNV